MSEENSQNLGNQRTKKILIAVVKSDLQRGREPA